VIDEPERRPLLKRLIARFPEDLGDPPVRPFVLANSAGAGCENGF
jgi:hypothetical protein